MPRPSFARPSSLATWRTALLAMCAFIGLVVAGLAAPSRSSAQCGPDPCLNEDLRLRAFDVQLFRPPAGQGTTFLIDRAEPLRHLSLSAGLFVDGAASPLVRRLDGTETPVVGWLGQGRLSVALGLFELLEFGIVVPVLVGEGVAATTSQAPNLVEARSSQLRVGVGDVELSGKLTLVRQRDLGVALRLGIWLPPCAGALCNEIPWFMSTRYWTVDPSLIVTYHGGPVDLTGTIGYRLRQRREIGALIQDDEIYVAAGAAWRVVDALSIVLDGQYRFGMGSLYAGAPVNTSEMPAEVDLGLRIHPSSSFTIDLGAGRGLSPGYGSPVVRAFAGARIQIDSTSCTLGPEDNDGWQDGDFCLDPDNDGDGVEDGDDRCPNDPEDPDGFADEDGCADPDNDADGLLDGVDQCPLQSEDTDAYQDTDGCPEPDNDEDHILDGVDQCPMDPEDLDNFEDEDGCPEPGPRTLAVTVSDTRILIGETIYFEYDTDTIRPVSTPLLDQVAQVIGTLDAALRIRVEGHTDNQGSDSYNLDLSYRRARAVVEYLVGRGVSRDRLEYRGYGFTHPVVQDTSPQGQSLNRRVEFSILRPGEPATTDTPAPRRRRHTP